MKLEEVQFKLLAEIQSLPPELALEFCVQAVREISEVYDWSFLYKKDLLRTPALLNVGTVEVTEFSTDVIINDDLKAILDGVSVDDVKIEGRQFRTTGGQYAGEIIYNITEYDSDNSKLIIDPYYQDQTNSAASYSIFKNLYTASEIDIDFSSFEYIIAPFARRKLGLDLTRSELDRRDLNRTSTGEPFHIVNYGFDSEQNQLFELYPIPTNKRIYQTFYKKNRLTLSQDDELPKSLTYELVKAKAKILAYEWLSVNGDKVGDKRSPNVFMNLIAMLSNERMENSYPKKLQEAKNYDENLYPQALIDMGESFPYYQEIITEVILMDF